jgi:hypothetical protein
VEAEAEASVEGKVVSMVAEGSRSEGPCESGSEGKDPYRGTGRYRVCEVYNWQKAHVQDEGKRALASG